MNVNEWKKSTLVSFWYWESPFDNHKFLFGSQIFRWNQIKRNVSLNGHFVVYNYFGKFMILSEKQNWLPFFHI